MKDAHSFMEELGSEEREKVKMRIIEPIEDQVESHCDGKQKLACCHLSQGHVFFLIVLFLNF